MLLRLVRRLTHSEFTAGPPAFPENPPAGLQGPGGVWGREGRRGEPSKSSGAPKALTRGSRKARRDGTAAAVKVPADTSRSEGRVSAGKAAGGRQTQHPAAHPDRRRAGAAGPRTHAQTPRNPDPGRLAGPRTQPRLLLGSSTHQELEHGVGEERAKSSCSSVGRSEPASPRARGGTRRGLPGHARPRPRLPPRLASPRLTPSRSRRPGAPWRRDPELPPGLAEQGEGLSGGSLKSQAGLDGQI